MPKELILIALFGGRFFISTTDAHSWGKTKKTAIFLEV